MEGQGGAGASPHEKLSRRPRGPKALGTADPLAIVVARPQAAGGTGRLPGPGASRERGEAGRLRVDVASVVGDLVRERVVEAIAAENGPLPGRTLSVA